MEKYKTIFGRDNGTKIEEPYFFTAFIYANNENEAKEKADKLFEIYKKISNWETQVPNIVGYGLLTTKVQ